MQTSGIQRIASFLTLILSLEAAFNIYLQTKFYTNWVWADWESLDSTWTPTILLSYSWSPISYPAAFTIFWKSSYFSLPDSNPKVLPAYSLISRIPDFKSSSRAGRMISYISV